MEFDVKNKIVLITGGSRGIGEAAALEFGKMGAFVIVTSRKQPDLEKVSRKINEAGGRYLAPRIQQLRQRQKQLQTTRFELEQQLSDRRVQLADAETVAHCVTDLRNLLNESSLTERKSFIRSFVKEVKVTGEEVLLTYTIPMLPKGISEEKVPVLSIGHYGGA